MKGINMKFLGLLLALLVVLFSCEQPVRDNAADKKSDDYELEVSCNRADGTTVAVYQALVFTFSDTMIPETLVVSGTANITDADWSGAAWTEGDLPQDTVTLDPRALSTPGLWNVGEAGTLTLQCSSVNGQTVEQSFTFEIVIDLEVSSLTEEGAMVAAHEALSFTFRHSMVPATLVVSGDANVTGADWSEALWTEGESPNDTLTLDPRALSTPGLWNVGEARTITLQCSSVNGQTVTQSFTFEIVIDLEFSSNTEEGSMVSAHEALSFSFNYSMVPATLVVSGDANVTGADWSDALWTEAVSPNDTVTLDPRALSTPGLWTEGGTSTLTLQCTAVNGQTVTQSFSYLIENAVYVSEQASNANDTNPGTISSPFKTIQSAINKADELFETGCVRVARGDYNSNYRGTSNPVATLVSGISLYGGYNLTFSERNRALYETNLHDLSTVSGESTNPNRCVSILSAIIDRSTILDGFCIYVAAADEFSTGIWCNSADPTIQNNEIIYAGGKRDISGITLLDSSALLSRNIIFKEWNGGNAETSFGIRISSGLDSTVDITENWIYGGTVVMEATPDTVAPQSTAISDEGGSNIIDNYIFAAPASELPYRSVGISVRQFDTVITGNTIFCGSGKIVATCVLIMDCHPNIDDNQFSQEDSDDSQYLYAVVAMDTVSSPSSFSNNTFLERFSSTYSMQNALYAYLDGTFQEIRDFDTPIEIYNEAETFTLSELGNSETDIISSYPQPQ